MNRALGKSLSAVQGSLFALVSALFAEFLFAPFLMDGSTTAPLGRVMIVFLSLYTIHRFTLYSLEARKKTLHDLVCLGAILIIFLGILWMGKNLALSLSSYSPGLSTQSIYFAMPFAAGGLLLQVVLGIRYALVFGISLAVIVAMYSTDAPLGFLLVLVSTLVACLSLSRVRSRSAFIRSGILVTVVSLAFALSSILIDSNISNVDVLIRIFGAPFGGIVVVMIATAFMPVVEHLGGYVTDIRLIEMATLDHPLLKELSIQAPGTWNHSMVMGMMSEVAADAIGANPIVARVGCYFHDIGKVKKPLYFVENQLDGKNLHDKLSASMSALIIRTHVKDGVEMARRHRLPQVLIDMILQHHGTSLIEYFYDKAVKEAATQGDGTGVEKALFSYPGPRPQTREAGIIMLADSIEAASRTLSEPHLAIGGEHTYGALDVARKELLPFFK